MKFQKGILSETADPGPPKAMASRETVPVAKEKLQPSPTQTGSQRGSVPTPSLAEERLFETLEKETGNARKYLKVFGILVLLIIVVGIGVAYLTLPSVGDKVRAPAGLEDAVRDHFLTKEKRTATDIVFYKCDGFFGARVGVETRNDLPNPIFKLDSYSAKAVPNGTQWDITAAPLGTNEEYSPCR
jgi:hypothetical protein